MSVEQRAVSITVMDGEEVHILNARPGSYRSLMELIFDRIYTDGFGDCKGMGRCGTCLVEIVANGTPLPASERNEEATRSRLGSQEPNLRLSCQLLLDESLDQLSVRLRQE